MKSRQISKTAKTAKAAKPVHSAKAEPAAHTLVGEVSALAEVLRTHDLSELSVEFEGLKVNLRRGGAPTVVTHTVAAAAAAEPTATLASTPKAETSDGNISYITSPFVGTFYRSPGPDSAPFVDAGSKIKKGQVLCIIEAMKLMNEIPSEVDGIIVQVHVENGQPVEYGEPLFKIRQS